MKNVLWWAAGSSGMTMYGCGMKQAELEPMTP